jgi:glutathione peroxidase
MTLRQRLLKIFYPFLTLFSRLSGRGSKAFSDEKHRAPKQSIYDLSIEKNDGSVVKLDAFKGKKLMLVNTASDCGYTNQYDALQKLHERYGHKLTIIGFPANDFKEQERGTDAEIAEFCKVNFGVSFPLAKKSSVLKSNVQNPVFSWLSDASKNGWCNKQPSWNFSKYVVNEEGYLTHYFDPAISPMSDAIIKAIQ